MRFKAKLAPEQVSLLSQLIVPMARIASNGGVEVGSSVWTRNGGILYIDKEYLRISTKGKSNETDNIRCFAELKAAGGIFLEHRIESASNNVIVLEIDLVQLRTALQSKKSSQSSNNEGYSILKLAKRNNVACLCYEETGDVQVHHSIPVRVLKATEMLNHNPPQVEPDIQIEIGDKPLRNVVEGLKPLTSTICLEATTKGALTVMVDSDGASIRTFLTGLAVPDVDKASDCTVKVDIKKLIASLQWSPSSVSNAILCMVENEMLVVHAILYPASVGFFTYYVPVQYLSNDPAEE